MFWVSCTLHTGQLCVEFAYKKNDAVCMQRSLGKDTIRMHLPVALGGVGTAPSQKARIDADANIDANNFSGGLDSSPAGNGGGKLARETHHNGEGDSTAKQRRSASKF
jgi:hypothetical protein